MGQTGTLSSTEILQRVEWLLPEIQQRSDEIAQLRLLPWDLVGLLKEAGAFRIAMPRRWGGPEMSLPDQLRLVERLSWADPSVGWCVMIGSDSGYFASFLEEEAARALWTDLDAITSGWIFPAGRAFKVRGGYRVSGRWSFGSGCSHADVLLGGCVVVDEEGKPALGPMGFPVIRQILAPTGHWQLHDTWHTTGLAGSGSCDYSCSDLFVPDEHTFSLQEPSAAREPLYRFPGAFMANLHGVPLGLARRALDEVLGIAQHRVLLPHFTPMRDVPRVREALAEAEGEFRAARAYAYTTLEAWWSRLEAGGMPDEGLRADLIQSRLGCFRMARTLTMRLAQLAGTQAIYATSLLERLLRDAITLHQHAVAGPSMAEAAGALYLGASPTGALAPLL